MSTDRTVRELQASVDRSIRHVGGYWRALSAVARLLEELGELSAELESGDRDAAASEAADLFVITTCLANQYCADLAQEYRRIGLPVRSDALRGLAPPGRSPRRHYLHLLSAAGAVARTVNAYEGDKRPKAGEEVPTLSASVARLHRALFFLAAVLRVDLVAQVEAVLARTLTRDAGRFAVRFDPAAAGTLARFETIRSQIRCPFARRAKLWGAPDWDPAASPGRNLRAVLPHLERFTRISRHEHLDGFVLEIPGPGRGETVEVLARTLRATLGWLARHDPIRQNCLQREVAAPGWQFTFNGERLFVITFAPCYGPVSARYGFGDCSVWVLFQPEHSFDALEITPAVRDAIRAGFEQAGQPYDLEIMSQPLEAPRYVKPLHIGDPPVAWWGGTRRSSPRRGAGPRGGEMAGRTPEELLEKFSPEVRDLTNRLRELIRASAPELKEEAAERMDNIYFKWNGVVCAITPYKSYTSLHFYKGTRLDDPQGLLEGGGTALRHLKIRKPEDVRPEVVVPFLQQAIRLNAG